MGDLLLLIGCPAAEVREQLLPACFVFGLQCKMETQFMFTDTAQMLCLLAIGRIQHNQNNFTANLVQSISHLAKLTLFTWIIL